MSKSVGTITIANNLFKHKDLIYSLTKRDIASKYRGSIIGIFWSFITPIFMLAIYTLVFGVIFNARWNGNVANNTEFSLLLFIGLILFNFFSEVLNKSPLLITSNVNYVKKVVFPLEILSIVNVLSSLFHALISLLIWMSAYFIFFGKLNLEIMYFFLIIFPFVLLLLGISWILSAFGTYIRDIIQVISVLTSALMFLSPVFFPISSLPSYMRDIAILNPLTFPIEQMRATMYYGYNPDWQGLILYTILSIIILVIGFNFFQRTRRGFSDVV